MKKYYQVFGDKSARFSMDADIPINRICKIMGCKRVKEISFAEYCMPRGNIAYLLEKLKRSSRNHKCPKLSKLRKK